MFPLQALRKTTTTAYITYGIILINILVFLWELTLVSRGQLGQTFMELALVPCAVRRSPLSLDTFVDSFRAMFLHGGWLHLIGNMVFLRVFGPAVEDYMGKVRFLAFIWLPG
ncbi:rhomboid family intramembrane serine protease [bacterium]|nr:rhomboid family intramembrane serine protease [bacterium]